MNAVDYAILGVVAVSLLFGLYRGFITSVLGLAALFAAMFAAYSLGPSLAQALLKNDTVRQTLIHYTDAASRLGDLELSMQPVASLATTSIADIVSRVSLPAPLNDLLTSNLAQQVFASIGSATVADYINDTLVSAIIYILAYLGVFAVAYLALSLVTGLLGYIFHFSALKHLDALLGGAFGLVRGVFLVYIFFALVPIAMTVLPFPEFGELVTSSQLGAALYQSNIVSTILQGSL